MLPGSFDILDGVIRVYDGARYLSVFAPKKYDAIDNKIRWHISQNGITHVFFHNLVRIQVGSFYSVPLEEILTLYNVIILIKLLCNKGKNHFYFNISLEKCLYQLA